MAHFHVSVCLLGPPGTSWLAFGKLWGPFFDTWGLLGSLESVLGEFLGVLGAPGTFPGTLGRVLPGASVVPGGGLQPPWGPWVAPIMLLESSWSGSKAWEFLEL